MVSPSGEGRFDEFFAAKREVKQKMALARRPEQVVPSSAAGSVVGVVSRTCFFRLPPSFPFLPLQIGKAGTLDVRGDAHTEVKVIARLYPTLR